MESDLTTTSFARGFTPPRDHGAYRRAYLDTYAKRRAGTVNSQPVVNEAVQLPEAVTAPTKHVTRPSVLTVELAAPTENFMQPQPAVDNFNYVPAQSIPVQNEDVSPHRSYLDTLTTRHKQAVAEAPAAVETVFKSALSEDTQTLFDDPQAEAKLEANLRALYSEGTLTSLITTNN